MHGIRLDIAEWRRPDPVTALVPRQGVRPVHDLHALEARRRAPCGYADALMLDWLGRVAECTGANVFFTQDGAIHTPIADCFLDGITRRTVIELAHRRGIAVIERRIMPDELDAFEECFICGTGAEVTPVSEIGPHTFKPGADRAGHGRGLRRRGAARSIGRRRSANPPSRRFAATGVDAAACDLACAS